MDGFVALYIFVLAAFTGYEIIGRVPVILHTPLMSGSNFVHGIVLVGAMVVLGHADSTPEKGFYYRSDHFSFAKRGVPMLYLDYGLDLVNGGLEAGKAYHEAYYDHIYHSPRDEFHEDWDWSGALDDVWLYYLIGRKLADSGDWPNWYPGDEFRAIRDASCSGEGGC